MGLKWPQFWECTKPPLNGNSDGTAFIVASGRGKLIRRASPTRQLNNVLASPKPPGKVDELLGHPWSPERIRGRLKREHGHTSSHKWIYQHIYHNKRAGGELFRFLRCQKVRRKRYGTWSRREQIPDQVSIERAARSGEHSTADWRLEGDTIIRKGHRGAMVTLVERRSKYTVVRGVRQKTASAV